MSKEKAKWTLLTYIAAHNDLHAMGERSLDQLLSVGSSTDVILGVLFDTPHGAARYIIGDPGLVQLQEQLPDFDSGDPDQLLESARWLFRQCPAERYGLILWSHGSGWQPEEIEQVARQVRGDDPVNAQEAHERSQTLGSVVLFRTTLAALVRPVRAADRAILFDDGTGHSLDTLELARILATLQAEIAQPLDLLGMDACLMATLEVAYQLRHNVHCLVASEELVPGHSWPYDEIFQKLRNAPTLTAPEVATAVVQQYTAHYQQHPPGAGDVTKVALDLSRIEPLADAVSHLAQALATAIDQEAQPLWKAQTNCQQRETRKGNRRPSKFDYHLWDLKTMTRQLLATSANPTIHAAALAVAQLLQPGKAAILAEGHVGDWFDGIGGLSIYCMLPGPRRISPHYQQLALTQATRWGDLLATYHEYYQ